MGFNYVNHLDHVNGLIQMIAQEQTSTVQREKTNNNNSSTDVCVCVCVYQIIVMKRQSTVRWHSGRQTKIIQKYNQLRVTGIQGILHLLHTGIVTTYVVECISTCMIQIKI